jgi:hypothetical protein
MAWIGVLTKAARHAYRKGVAHQRALHVGDPLFRRN